MQTTMIPSLLAISLGALFFLGVAILCIRLVNVLKTAALSKKILISLCLVLIMLFSALGVWAVKTLLTYEVFTYKELIGIIRCVKSEDKSYNFALYYTPVKYNKEGPTHVYLIRGDQWSFGGDVLKWHPWLSILGAKPCHKPTRISGRFVRAKDSATVLPTEYDINNGSDKLWIFLHKSNQYLPFVETVYGNSIYTFIDYKHYFKIYVTSNGYMIKKEVVR